MKGEQVTLDKTLLDICEDYIIFILYLNRNKSSDIRTTDTQWDPKVCFENLHPPAPIITGINKVLES